MRGMGLWASLYVACDIKMGHIGFYSSRFPGAALFL